MEEQKDLNDKQIPNIGTKYNTEVNNPQSPPTVSLASTSESTQPIPQSRNRKPLINSLVIFILLLLIGCIIYYLIVDHKQSLANKNTTTNNSKSASIQLPNGFSWYTNSQYGFRIAYPTVWQNPTASLENGATSGWDLQLNFKPTGLDSAQTQIGAVLETSNYKNGA